MNNEKDRFGSHESFDDNALAEHGKELQEKLSEKRERAAEKSPERNVESAKREALEHAKTVEKERVKTEKKQEVAPAERRPATAKQKKASFDATMKEARSQMSAPSRAFSKVIHNPAVEKASDVVGGTVARPNAILLGSLFAFIATLITYLVARYYGYPLTGSITIASFAIGWVVGLIVDYIRLLVLGKRS